MPRDSLPDSSKRYLCGRHTPPSTKSDDRSPFLQNPRPQGGIFPSASSSRLSFTLNQHKSTIVGRGGNKLVSGAIVPIDTVQGEVDRMLRFDGRRYVARVFPFHYPRAQNLYYGGFEIFVLRDPTEVTIGGIEKGPASRAGAHWGDDLLSVNDLSIARKSPDQLEEMFTSEQPGVMKLIVSRLGVMRTFNFRLEAAGHVADLNGKRFVGSQIVPSWASDQDVHCFLK